MFLIMERVWKIKHTSNIVAIMDSKTKKQSLLFVCLFVLYWGII